MTLVELLIVVSVIAILVVALGFYYQGWVGRYNMETAVKGMYSDLRNAQARAIQQNATYLVDFPGAMTYRVAVDTNGNGAIDAGEVLPGFPATGKNVGYTINGGVLITFDQKGLIYTGGPPPTLIVPTAPVGIYLTSGANPIDADYDCVSLAPTKLYIGKWGTPTPAVCNAK